MSRHVGRRAFVKLAYATPVVAASMRVSGAFAYLFDQYCRCYEHFEWVSEGSCCTDPRFGDCASCHPDAGTGCPPTAQLVTATGVPHCIDPETSGPAGCVAARRPICLISP